MIHTRVSLRLKHLNNPTQYHHSIIAVYNNQEHISLHTERERERERDRESERDEREIFLSSGLLGFPYGPYGPENKLVQVLVVQYCFDCVFFKDIFFELYCTTYYIVFDYTRLYVSVQSIYQP